MLKSNGKHFDFVFIKDIAQADKDKLTQLFGYSKCNSVGTLFATTPISDYDTCLLSGSAVIDGQLLTGPCEATGLQAQQLAQQQETSGSFVVIKISEDEVVVGTDSFGLSQVYFYEAKNNIILGNNSFLVGALVNALYGNSTLDVTALAAQWVFPNAFGVQLNTPRLPLTGLTLLRESQYLRINTRGWHVEQQDDCGLGQGKKFEHSIGDREYWQLVERGAEEILANVNAVIESHVYDRTVVNITGGRDSRLILAAVACLGKAKSVVFKTRFSSQREDDIATGLVAYIGGQYDDYAASREYEVDPVEAIKKQLYFKAGLYHDVKFPRSGVDLTQSNSARLIGGCGEIYRTFYTSTLRKQFDKYHVNTDQYSVERAVNDFFHGSRLWDTFGLPDTLKESAMQALISEVISLPGISVSQKLEAHYLAYRNRFHFGMSTHIPNKEGDIHQPLTSKSLIKLARQVPPEVLSSGKLLFDVTSMFSPTIARMAYASKSVRVDFSKLPFYRRHPLDTRQVNLPAAPHLKEEAKSRKTALRGQQSIVKSKRVSVEHYRALKNVMLDKALDKLRADKTLNHLLNDKLLAKMRWNLNKEGKFARVWWSRMVSAAEYLDFEITDPLESKL